MIRHKYALRSGVFGLIDSDYTTLDLCSRGGKHMGDAISGLLEALKYKNESYTRYMQSTRNEGLRKLLRSLVDQMRESINEINECPCSDQIIALASGDNLDHLYQRSLNLSETDDLASMQAIVEQEEKAYLLYQRLSNLAETDESRYLLKRFSDESKKHWQLVRDRYDLMVFTGN